MGAERVTDLGIFQQTCSAIRNNVSLVHEACCNSLSEANCKFEETQEELANSRRLLQEAIAEEQRRLLIKQECEAEVEAAAAGLPETAGWYADACARLAIAIEEYERAVAHRVLMEQRVALAEQCVSMAQEMVSTLTDRYNYGQNQINSYASLGINRLSSADRATFGYVNESLNVSSANVTTSKGNETKGKNKVYCENLGMEIVFVASAPGQEEAKQGRPLAGESGKHLDEILSHLKYKGKNLSRDSISIDNAWTKPLWDGKDGETEASLGNILSDANLLRLNEDIGPNTKIVVPLGKRAERAVLAVKEKFNRNFVVLKDICHPSLKALNCKYTTEAQPSARTADRLRQMSEDIKAASGGMIT